jgi:predicted lipoprotein with Yx(FWY)xxD motif
MKRTIQLLLAAAAPLVIALAAVACGSSPSGSSYSSDPYGPPVKASAPNRIVGSAKVGIANSTLGRIVVDGKGRTLYLFEKDAHRRSACYGQCAKDWLPVLTHGKPMALAGVTQSRLGVSRRANGSEQASYAGHPLYRFVEDKKAGQIRGEGSQDFGAGWGVLSPAGKEVETDD